MAAAPTSTALDADHVCQSDGECAVNRGASVYNADDPGALAVEVHRAAGVNDVDSLRSLQIKPEFAMHRDDNGWQPIHEAAFSGHVEVVRMLLMEHGVDVNSRTPKGETPLWFAKHLPIDHPVILILQAAGGISTGPVNI